MLGWDRKGKWALSAGNNRTESGVRKKTMTPRFFCCATFTDTDKDIPGFVVVGCDVGPSVGQVDASPRAGVDLVVLMKVVRCLVGTMEVVRPVVPALVPICSPETEVVVPEEGL